MPDRPAPRSLLSTLTLAALVLLAFSLPFEWPGLALGPLRITNLEILVALVLLLTTVHWLRDRRAGQTGRWPVPRSWLLLWGLFVLALFLSALFAPAEQANAFKAALRTFSGLLLALAVPLVLRRRRDLWWVAGGLVAGAALSLAIGLAEILTQERFAWLESLRLIATDVGPFQRLSGTFNHANQAAMFLEATWPLLAALLWEASRRRRWVLVAAGGVLLLLFMQGSIFTYSRASYVTILLSGLIVAVVAGWPAGKETPGRWRGLPLLWAGIAGLLAALVVGNFLVNPVMRLRLQSEQDNEWYALQMEVPAELSVTEGTWMTPTVTIHNEGLLLWQSVGTNPINLGARWFRVEEGETAVIPLAVESRWPLPEVVSPGERATVSAPLRAPSRPGTYQMEWDMVQEGVVWFGEKNGLTHTSLVVVAEGEEGREVVGVEDSAWSTPGTAPGASPPIPGRSFLWPLAGRMLAENPLLGIGLDNFRLRYGPFSGAEVWNDTVTTNNWYLETLVSVGILGAIPFFFWLALLGVDLFRRLRGFMPGVWTLAIATALLAFLIHGLLDYFLLFYNTGLLFWLLVGLWAAHDVASTTPAGIIHD